MKGLILSGGTGTRLRPLTFTSAKQLLPVANRPILCFAIDALRDVGIHDIGIVVGTTAPEVKNTLGDGSSFGIQVTYLHQSEPLGLAHAVSLARPFLGEEPFVMMLGDNVIHGGFQHAMKQFMQTRVDALVLTGPVDDPQHFGIVQLQGDRIVRLVEKPSRDLGNLALCGVYFFNPVIHAAIRAITPSPRGELEITDAVQWLVDHHFPVSHTVVTSWWKDTGRPNDLLEANRLLLEDLTPDIQGSIDHESVITGPIQVGSGTTIRKSTLRGPISIGHNVHIENAYIGPYTSIGDDVTIHGTDVEYSVILSGCIIDQAPRLDQCLLGRYVEIVRTTRNPRSVRMVLGDQSICEWS